MPLSPIPTGAGNLNCLFAFDRRIQIDDGAGNYEGQWQEQFQADAGKSPMLGGESVRAGRLTGIQPWILTIRYDDDSATVTPEWRCRDVDTGRAYAIRSVVDWKGRYLDLVIVEGEAQ